MVEFRNLSAYPSLSIHDQAKRRLSRVEVSSASVHVYNKNMERNVFSIEELAMHDGVQNPAYVACQGKAYDVYESFLLLLEGFPVVCIMGDRE